MSARQRTPGRAAPRLLLREHDGGLVDERDGRPVTPAELRDDLRAGRRFRVRRAGGGACTYAVLAELLTGREHAIGAAAAPRPRTLLERALSSALDWDDERRERPRERPQRTPDPAG